MVKKIAAIQSNYIPWKGYFDIIRSVDEFVLYDDVSYTPKNWRNRNTVKTPKGQVWLTIPVQSRGSQGGRKLIKDMVVLNQSWPDKHWATIRSNYGRTRHFNVYGPYIKNLYETAKSLTYLSDINYHFISGICQLLEINTKVTFSMDYDLRENGKCERPLELALKSDADSFVTGSVALEYYDLDKWKKAGVKVEVFDYDGYPEYWQPFPPFEHHVSIIDLLLSAGERALEFMHRE